MKARILRMTMVAAAVAAFGLLVLTTATREAVAQGNMSPLLVRVVNGIAEALPVRDVENPAREGLMLTFSCNSDGGSSCSTDGYQVPEDRRLVVEQAFVHAVVPPGQSVSVSLRHPTILDTHALDIERQGTFGNFDFFAAARPARMYVNAGETILAVASRSSFQGNLFVEVRLAGYLLACGSGAGCPIP